MVAGGEQSLTNRFQDQAGFSLPWIPVIMLVGLVFLVVSVPNLFQVLADSEVSSPILISGFTWLNEISREWSRLIAEGSLAEFSELTTKVAVVSVAAILVAAGFRSVVQQSALPVSLTALGLVGGILVIPLVSWAVIVTMTIVRLAMQLWAWISTLIELISPLLKIVVYVGTAAAVLFFGSVLLRILWDLRRRWPVALAVLITIAAVAYSGWLETVWQAIRPLLETVVTLAAKYLGLALGWVILALIWIGIVALISGLLIGILGTIGRTIYLSIGSAKGAGRHHENCADFSAAMGGTLSLILAAAVLDPGFGSWLSDVLLSMPVIRSLPNPIALYNIALPSSAERVLEGAFVNYSPLVDSGLVAFIGLIAALSLLFSARRIGQPQEAKLIRPVMLATGAAVAAVVPVVLAMIWVRSESE